jgi:hypothetical protein
MKVITTTRRINNELHPRFQRSELQYKLHKPAAAMVFQTLLVLLILVKLISTSNDADSFDTAHLTICQQILNHFSAATFLPSHPQYQNISHVNWYVSDICACLFVIPENCILIETGHKPHGNHHCVFFSPTVLRTSEK